MKNHFTLLLTVLISFIFTSCATTSFYQVYKVNPSDNMINEKNYLVYEDENCKVFYNLWSEKGDIGFEFYNKTNKNIFLDLAGSFFILNGISHDYFLNRTVTQSAKSGNEASKAISASKSITGINYFNLLQSNNIQAAKNVTFSNSSGISVSYKENPVIVIPAKTSKSITEYDIQQSLFRDCDLLRYPRKNETKTKKFTESNSPIVFSNRLQYRIGSSENTIRFENSFYVSAITNYSKGEAIETKAVEFCGEKSYSKVDVFKNAAPNKFYIKYSREKGAITFKH